MDRTAAEAVLITGVYGSGKTSTVEEIADVLEHRGVHYAALDLDWLAWFDAGWDDEAAENRMMLRNLDAVVANYSSAEIRFFVLALSIENQSQLDSIKDKLGVPLRVVRLDVPLETISERVRSDVTTARQVDLHWAGVWIDNGTGVGLEDLTVRNDRPIREVALEILELLGWLTM